MPASRAARSVSSGSALGHLDHAADGEDAVERRRLGLGAAGRSRPSPDHLGEDRFVDAEALPRRRRCRRQAIAWMLPRDSRAAHALAHRQARVARSPAGTRTRMSSPLPLTLRSFPRPAVAVARAVGAGKTGHASKRHCASSPRMPVLSTSGTLGVPGKSAPGRLLRGRPRSGLRHELHRPVGGRGRFLRGLERQGVGAVRRFGTRGRCGFRRCARRSAPTSPAAPSASAPLPISRQRATLRRCSS